jgi:1,4-alpha-glucan branching enzyme
MFSLFSDFDIALFKAGKHYRLYEKLGSFPLRAHGTDGTYFAVWAPNAKFVSVICNSNGWDRHAHPLQVRLDGSGIWEGFLPGIGKGEIYKYYIHSHFGDRRLEEGDPFARRWEIPPHTASIVWDTSDYDWQDKAYLDRRRAQAGKPRPYSVYEVHLGSWMLADADDGGKRSLTYRELAEKLVPYLVEMGFTHVEFMPVMEHPYAPSWGYQITGYFAPSSRFGSPQDFMFLVDCLHGAGIGVLLDWVPSHFPEDMHGLAQFDGTRLYEHADPRKGFHPDWKSLIFNYGRFEVKSFLISNALFWLDHYHADGLRVDAVASMLYLDYSRKEGEWIPNMHGGRENLEAIAFLKELNETVYGFYPDVETIAEESTAFHGVSRPTFEGGLGFGQKWMMGWMNDTLRYFKEDPLFRQYHHHSLTFSLVYAFSENFMLPLSHDEVVHGKGSLISRMPGDEWQRFANMRLLFGYMFTHPGNQLLFMGGEFGQTAEWSHEHGLDWWLLQYPVHRQLREWVKQLNAHYVSREAFWEKNYDPEGFRWVIGDDSTNSVLAYLRFGTDAHRPQLVVLHFTPVVRENYRVGVPFHGEWVVALNSDDPAFGGSGIQNARLKTQNEVFHGYETSLSLTLPPLSVLVLEPKSWKTKEKKKS